MSAQQDTAELAVSIDDVAGVLNQPVLEDRVNQALETDRRFREIFRDYDATNVSTRSIEIPVQNDEMDNPTVVAEGAEFPRTQETYDLKRLEFEKFGFEVGLTMEAQADSQIDLVQDQVDKKADQMADDLNRRAFENMKEGIASDHVGINDGGSDGIFTFEDLLQGREQLVKEAFSPDMLIADVQTTHDLMGNSNFLEATEAQSDLRRSGEIGQIAGLDVIEDDSGLNLTGNANPGALLVDTDEFGWEATRTPVTSEEYSHERTQEDVYRSFTRKGWTVTRPEAAVIIEG